MLEVGRNSLNRLMDYCEKEQFKGYDPYDAQNSLFPISKFPHSFKFAITQVNKRSPVNLRHILFIKKGFYTKAMALFCAGYCNLFKLTKEDLFLEKAKSHLDWILQNTSSHSENICWGYDYHYASRHGNVNKGFPTVVHHSYVLQALYKLWQLEENQELFDLIDKSKYFILNDIPVNKYENGICFGYHSGSIGCCYNASLHAAECLAVVDKINNQDVHFALIKKAVHYVISRQKPSGEWLYSHGLNQDKEKKQIDFHQGFILDCLRSINRLCDGRLEPIIDGAIQKGLEFYYSRQFDEEGMGVFRYPAKYPADIHNQAQGIITFSRFADLDYKYLEKAETILSWTIKNMQDPEGFFYYQKYRFFTNKTPYIRWAQAWMFFAMTEYLLVKSVGANND